MFQKNYKVYSVKKIAVGLNSPINLDTSKFRRINYNGKSYHLLYDINFQLLRYDISKNTDFFLESNTNGDTQYLWLHLILYESSEFPRKIFFNKISRRRLIEFIFYNIDHYGVSSFVDINSYNLFYEKEEIGFNYENLVGKLFHSIKSYHDACDSYTMPDLHISNSLLTIKLRPYQIKAIRWLFKRETVKTYATTTGIVALDKDNTDCGVTFHINEETLQFTYKKSKKYELPAGGILADEMGLGKTIEILTLILLHRRENKSQNINQNSNSIDKNNDDNNDKELPPIKKRKIATIKAPLYCICMSNKYMNVIECIECHTVQHKICVANYDDQFDMNYEENYLCPECWISKHKNSDLIKSSATIIITPTIIVNQWYDEIRRCSAVPLKIFHYEGTKYGWINPEILSKYDIIITDYTVLQREFHFQRKKLHNLRIQKKYMRTESPLLFIEWWRVCLDEAQMVENATNNASKMAKLLPAVHRWAVTGTPIDKSLDDLRGLLEFLDAFPFYTPNIWKELLYGYYSTESAQFIAFFGQLMWRTCKQSVIDEIGIPPQSHVIHYVRMSDIEKFLYLRDHKFCLSIFEEEIEKIQNIDEASYFDFRTRSSLLEPLRKLQQTCSAPVLRKKSHHYILRRKFLTPQESRERIIDKNRLACRTSLRTMASSYNGMAAIHLIKGEFRSAISCYEKVLELAKTHTGPICVDSLLQIHALHNLIWTIQTINLQDQFNNFKIYEDEYKRLEWNYLESYYKNLMKVKINVETIINDVNEHSNKLSNYGDAGKWWKSILQKTNMNGLMHQIISRINVERQLLSESSSLNTDFSTIFDIDYALGIWTNKIISLRKNIHKCFQLFNNFMCNNKPLNQLSKNIQNDIRGIVQSVFNCHLSNIRNNNSSVLNQQPQQSSGETDKEELNNGRANLCNLCQLKQILLEYECTIFNKTINNQNENTTTAQSDLNPSFQETILKSIITFVKLKFSQQDIKDLQNNIEQGEIYLRYLDCLKKEQRELTKLWIEVECMIKAYNELDMCKTRLQMCDFHSGTANCDTARKLSESFIQNTLELESVRSEFKHKQARFNYINHLTSKPDLGSCPICNRDDYTEYSVLICGHFLCIHCTDNLVEQCNGLKVIKCPLCRQQQLVKDVLLVTKQNQQNEEIRVRGEYSSKIENIIRTIIRLKNEDQNVKILIFSHWNIILDILKNAFDTNDISCVLYATPKNIQNFKDLSKAITCFLLPLRHSGKGLNLIEATHVFLVEPILNFSEEFQAINRVHRIGQTKPPIVHQFVVEDTIEEAIQNLSQKDRRKTWNKGDFDLNFIRELFIMSYKKN